MVKNLLRVFRLQSDQGSAGIFFRKVTDGRYLFYPWGYPGESFYISEQQQHKVNAFLSLLAASFLMSIVATIFFDSNRILIAPISDYLVAVVCMLLPIVYILFVRSFSKGKEFFIPSEADRPIKKSSTPWIIIFIQIFTLWNVLEGDTANAMAVAYAVISLLFMAYISYLILRICKKKGYYLSEPK